MFALPDFVSSLRGIKSHPCEDSIDRLNFSFSTMALLVMAVVTGSRQHFGHPISCMPTAESTESWINYYHDYCYIQDKLRLSRISPSNQWVPFLLLFEAICFILPKILWIAASESIGYGRDVVSVVEAAVDASGVFGQDRMDKLSVVAHFTVSQSRYTPTIIGGSRSSLLYISMKWLCLANSILQIFFIAFFVAGGDLLWAVKLTQGLLNGTHSHSSGYFPLVTVCEVDKIEMGSIHRHSMQCLLMFNFLNEKLFLLLFYWLSFISVANLASALKHSFRVVLPSHRLSLASSLMPPLGSLSEMAGESVGGSSLCFFVHSCLSNDGVLLLEAISRRGGRLAAHHFSSQLFSACIHYRDAKHGMTRLECGEPLKEKLLSEGGGAPFFPPHESSVSSVRRRCYTQADQCESDTANGMHPTAPLVGFSSVRGSQGF